MAECPHCGAAVTRGEESAALRGPGGVYHLGCTPADLLATAHEEYQAIVRKGVRYFVEKYGLGPATGDGTEARFLALGVAIAREQSRRARP